MKGLLLFRVDSGNQAFDERLEALLKGEHKKYIAAYHLEDVHVCIGAGHDDFNKDTGEWKIRTSSFGEVLNVGQAMAAAGKMATYLYGKINNNQDEGCSAVFISSGESAAGTAAIMAARMFSMQIQNLYPVRIHIMVLQDQYVHMDPAASRLMLMLAQSNAVRPVFYASQYLLPWEDEENTRESTRMTVASLVKAMMIGQSDPMMLKMAGSMPMWFETAAVYRLEAPVERITHRVFSYLSESFNTTVLQPVVQGSLTATEMPKGVQSCKRSLERYVDEIERTTLLPTMQDLLCIMPLRNPPVSGKLDPDMSVGDAWNMIFRIYGQEKGAELQKLLNPSLEEMDERYKYLGESLKSEMLRQVIELARSTEQDFSAVPMMLQQVGDSLTKEEKNKKNPEQGMEADFSRGLLLSREKKEAISMAKARHLCLSIVHKAAATRLNERRSKLRAQAMVDAVVNARQFVNNCFTRLNSEFQKMCSIYQTQPVEKNCFDNCLPEAYDYWCSQSQEVELIQKKEIFDFFSNEVFDLSPQEAAGVICGALKEELLKRTEAAMDSIRVHVESFFTELSFRDTLLKKQTLNRNLDQALMQYFRTMNISSPILYQDRTGKPIDIRARALIFDVAEANKFSSISAMGMVVNDPHEKGVQLVVKYAGNALNDVLVYQHNPMGNGNAPANHAVNARPNAYRRGTDEY